VPASLRYASLGLGVTKWQTIQHHVLPYAIPGILTGVIISVSRAIGDAACLIVVGAPERDDSIDGSCICQ
jgi:phosphate transport system permease protein